MACWSTASVELCLSQVLECFFASAVTVIFASLANLRSNSNHRVSATHLISPVACFDVRASCKFILVCEKESVFNRLAAEGFCRFAKCVFTAVAQQKSMLLWVRAPVVVGALELRLKRLQCYNDFWERDAGRCNPVRPGWQLSKPAKLVAECQYTCDDLAGSSLDRSRCQPSYR